MLVLFLVRPGSEAFTETSGCFCPKIFQPARFLLMRRLSKVFAKNAMIGLVLAPEDREDARDHQNGGEDP